MSLEKLNTEIRQQQITRAALDMASTQGLKGLSMAGIARRVGLVPSALYRHFNNKDEVVDGVLDLIRDRLLSNVEAVRNETREPMGQLRRLLIRHAQLIVENKGIPRIVFFEDIYTGHPERKARAYKMITDYLDEVAEIVRKGQQERRIRHDIDPGTASMMFLGIVQPAAVLWHMSDGAFDVMRHVEGAWKAFVAAVQEDASNRKPQDSEGERNERRKNG